MIKAGTPLTSLQQRVISWIQERWLAGYGFPSKAQFRSTWPEFDLEESLQHDIFLRALDNRGISPGSISEHGLSNEQLAAISVICNFEDTRSRAAKLKSLGITSTRWQGWLRNKAFKEYMHTFSSASFEDNLHVAHEGLLKAVDKGNVEAVKFYLEATGRYTPQSAQEHNIKLILARVIESIQKHVKDPNVLRAIATDFELIMSGTAPEPVEISAPSIDV